MLARRAAPRFNQALKSLAQFRVIEQFLDVAHPIGPLTEAFAGDRPARTVGGSTKLSLAARLTIRSAAATKRSSTTAVLLPLSALLRLASLTLVAALCLYLPLLSLLALFSLLFPLLPLLSGLTSLLLLTSGEAS